MIEALILGLWSMFFYWFVMGVIGLALCLIDPGFHDDPMFEEPGEKGAFLIFVLFTSCVVLPFALARIIRRKL